MEMQADDAWPSSRSQAEAVVGECEELGIGIVGWFDEGFPPRLREIPQPPAVIYFLGDLRVARQVDAAAVVGTRQPTDWGVRAARIVTSRLASKGWSVISGLAIGVDTVAHRTAIEEGAPTVAILGNGLATVYPASNRHLAHEIVDAGGLLLSEVPPRTKVEPRALVKRDRLQSGLAAITAVIQGGRSSGAMHTARYAYEQGRPLFCAAVSDEDHDSTEQDEGTGALLNEPGRQLPSLLPSWKRVAATRLSETPVARPLDEAALSNLSALTPDDPNPARLF